MESQRRSRRSVLRLSCGAAVALAGSLLAACGQASNATPTSAGASSAIMTASGAATATTATLTSTTNAAPSAAAGSTPAVKELEFMRPSGGPAEDKAYVAMLSGWGDAHPGVKATFVSAPGADYETKVLTEIASGVVHDVVGLQPGTLTVFARKGAILALDDYIGRSADLDKGDFFPAHWADGQDQGKQFSIPPDGSPLVVAYNVDLFKSNSVPLPTAAWTWDDCLKTAQQLTKSSGGSTTQFGCTFTGGGGNLLSFLFANDANVIDTAANTSTIASPNAVQVLNYLGDLNNKYHVNPLPSEMAGLGSNSFLSGKVAMMIANRGGLGTVYPNAPFKIGVAPLPKAPAGGHSGSQITPLQLVIETPNKHPDDAWLLLDYLASARSQLNRFTQFGGYPSRRSVANDPKFLASVEPSWVGTEVNQVYAQVAGAQGTGFIPHHPNWSQVNDALNKQLALLWAGKQPADTVAKSAQDLITPLLS
jgi:multiple sugar transport system substrate-binding protein